MRVWRKRAGGCSDGVASGRQVTRRHYNGFLRSSLLAPALTLLVGCTQPAGPAESMPLPAGAVPLAAPAQYKEWWSRTERCAGMGGDFTAVQWYVVPGADRFMVEGQARVGLRIQEGGTIRVVLAGQWSGDEMVVRHEMLHAILRREGHPQEYFVDRCQLTWETWAASGE